MGKSILVLVLLSLWLAACLPEEADEELLDDSPTLAPSATIDPIPVEEDADSFHGRSNPTQAALAAEGQPSVEAPATALATEAALPLQVFTAEGTLLEITYYRGNDPTSPLIILAHGQGETALSWDAFARTAQSRGYHLITANFSDFGETSLNHLPLMVDAVDSLGTIQTTTPIALIGVGSGADLAIRACANLARCRSVVAISPTDSTLSTVITSINDRSLWLVSADDDPTSSIVAEQLNTQHSGDHVWQRFSTGGHASTLFGTQPQLTELTINWLLTKVPLPVN